MLKKQLVINAVCKIKSIRLINYEYFTTNLKVSKADFFCIPTDEAVAKSHQPLWLIKLWVRQEQHEIERWVYTIPSKTRERLSLSIYFQPHSGLVTDIFVVPSASIFFLSLILFIAAMRWYVIMFVCTCSPFFIQQEKACKLTRYKEVQIEMQTANVSYRYEFIIYFSKMYKIRLCIKEHLRIRQRWNSKHLTWSVESFSFYHFDDHTTSPFSCKIVLFLGFILAKFSSINASQLLDFSHLEVV